MRAPSFWKVWAVSLWPGGRREREIKATPAPREPQDHFISVRRTIFLPVA